MGNKLELKDNGEVLATTSFDVVEISSIKWLDSLDTELKQEDGLTKTAFYGEEVKLSIDLLGLDGKELELEIIAKNDDGSTVALEEDERQPLTLAATVNGDNVVFEPFYISPLWMDKEVPVTYFFNLKIKGEESYIEENLPPEVEDQLKPIGFGKPDIFKIDKAKGYLLVKQSDGSKIGYTSGNLEDVDSYQNWFENDSEELVFSNSKQIDSYFDSVYFTYLFHWALRGEFGGEVNRKRVIKAFNDAGAKHKISASKLYVYACGEGMLSDYKIWHKNNLDEPVISFQTYGLDFFEKEVADLKSEGYLDSSFTSGGSQLKNIGDSRTPPTPFPSGANYALVRVSGKPMVRNEAGGPMYVYPVWFKDLENGVKGATAVYAKAYKLAIDDANASGWGELNTNQKMFYGYHKIQTPYESLTDFYGYEEKVFLIGEYSKNPDIKFIKHKAFHRFVAWRYILLGKYFNN